MTLTGTPNHTVHNRSSFSTEASEASTVCTHLFPLRQMTRFAAYPSLPQHVPWVSQILCWVELHSALVQRNHGTRAAKQSTRPSTLFPKSRPAFFRRPHYRFGGMNLASTMSGSAAAYLRSLVFVAVSETSSINRFIELVLCMSQCRGGNGDIPGHSS